MKFSTALLPLFLGAAAVDAKKKQKEETKFCYRDGVTASVAVSLDGYQTNDYDATAAWIDLGHFKIDDDEALLVEATVQTLFVKGIDLGDSSASIDIDSGAWMRAAIFKGCTSFSDCMTQNVYPIDPKPNAQVPIKVEYLEINRDDDYGNESPYGGEVYETNTGKFYFPAASLPKDDYYLSFAFYVDSDIWKESNDSNEVDVDVELGPHLVSVKKIKAEDEVCDVTVFDDDYVANEIFWD
mmetsp:Transcript_7843/g.21785  ORF Transcript_7843/g.21785 Transcript_7843/m.21785 type:complete len:240 (+) Transcript_7843:1396-2115(+)